MKKIIILVVAILCVAGMVYADTANLQEAEAKEKVVSMRADQYDKIVTEKVVVTESVEIRSEAERAAFAAKIDAALAGLGKTVEVKQEVVKRTPSPDVPLFVKKEIKFDTTPVFEEEIVVEKKVEKKVAPVKKEKKVTYGYSHK